MRSFITFEGIEGCGKSTQARLLARRLEQDGHRCLLTVEPGGTRIGRAIRKVLLDPANRRMAPEVELALYFADRAQHLREVIWPALDENRIVISDRFTDSTMAYQGFGRGLPASLIRRLDQALTGAFRPRITVLLDLPAEEGLARARRRNRVRRAMRREGRFEQEELAFHRRVREGYLRLSRNEPERFLVVPALGRRKDVHEEVWKRVSPRLAARADRAGRG